MDIRLIVRKHAAFGKLSTAALDKLVEAASLHRLHRGEALWRSGERAQSLVVVAHGLLKLVQPAPGSRDLVVGLFGPGESVGDQEILDHATHNTEALALTESVVFVSIPREAVVSVLEQSGPASLALARELGRRASLANRRISMFSASAEERLASTIIELGERFGDEMEDGSTLIPLRLTRAELAALVGTTVETAIRTLSRWSREGLVTTVDGGLNVHDPHALARRSAPAPSWNAGPPSAEA